jgi:hypothetical protein
VLAPEDALFPFSASANTRSKSAATASKLSATYLARQRILSHANGSFNAALLIMLHYPPDSMTASSMYIPTSSQSIFNLICKLGIEELGAGSDVEQFGVLLFDVCPRKSRNKYMYTRSHVPDHFRRCIRDMWAKSTARIGVVMGDIPEDAFLDVFQRRVRCVAKVDYNNKNDRLEQTGFTSSMRTQQICFPPRFSE